MVDKNYLQEMLDEAARFRARATYCRELIDSTTDPDTVGALRQIAEDLEEEAAKLEEGARRNES